MKSQYPVAVIMNRLLVLLVLAALVSCQSASHDDLRTVELLSDWRFHKGDASDAAAVDYDDSGWEEVKVPHDWAIKGPFDEEIDKASWTVGEGASKRKIVRTGRTGSLPYTGVGWYRTEIDVETSLVGKEAILQFEGAMSNAVVYVNGERVGEHPNGYNYFYFDIADHLNEGRNSVAVRLENLPYSSRWYPGAGLYRKVTLTYKKKGGFAHWGHFITTPYVSEAMAKINVKSKISANDGEVIINIYDPHGRKVATSSSVQVFDNTVEQIIAVKNPQLWSPKSPNLYKALIMLEKDGNLVDAERITFGIRDISYTAEHGFQLNGETMKFKGVCMHHDLGPLGAAMNVSALRRQLRILKDMGCNAIRTSHNMPSLEQLELCDEMGFFVMAESFDEWKIPKVKNGYNLHFEEWVKRDIEHLVRATRNHPSIVMWSSGNEVRDQHGTDGVKRAKWLQDIFHREDPTRPVTNGMDNADAVMESGFGALMDIPGFNYRVHRYEDAYEKFPHGFLLGSETTSTVSSRGIYKFPIKKGPDQRYNDGHSSSYDVEYCNWSNVPDDDWVAQDDFSWVIGEFVWTGFDYLGEPTPHNEYWPSRSSYFGISDLAGLPKDRYYLYRSRWNQDSPTLHVLPHWTWPDREGQVTPVYVYTSYPSAELLVNGVSQGIRAKRTDSTSMHRYRLMWDDVIYHPGEIEVRAMDTTGAVVMTKTVETAGESHHIELSADRDTILADGEKISFITARVVDEQGRLCPHANNTLKASVSGAGTFRAMCSGDPTSLELFHEPEMRAFSGQLVILVQSTETAGVATLSVRADGLEGAQIDLLTQK